ncbi:MAG: VanZ family protein [Glaciihabitans sp.]|nr:VanZ family protein [Glaciihabitans sp.]
MFLRHPLLSLGTLLYLGFVGYITLGPQPLDDRANSFLWRALTVFGRHDSTQWITYDRVEFGANIAMFVPIGLFFLLLFGRRLWWLAVIFGIGLTLGIEFIQLFLPNRVSDPRDLIANSSGAFIGVIVGLVLTAGKARRIRRAKAQQRPRPASVRTF